MGQGGKTFRLDGQIKGKGKKYEEIRKGGKFD
jgi:hypothetical protein